MRRQGQGRSITAAEPPAETTQRGRLDHPPGSTADPGLSLHRLLPAGNRAVQRALGLPSASIIRRAAVDDQKLWDGIQGRDPKVVDEAIIAGADVFAANAAGFNAHQMTLGLLGRNPGDGRARRIKMLVEAQRQAQTAAAPVVPGRVQPALPDVLIAPAGPQEFPLEVPHNRGPLTAVYALVEEYNYSLPEQKLPVDALVDRLTAIESKLDQCDPSAFTPATHQRFAALGRTITVARRNLNAEMRASAGLGAAVGAGSRPDRHKSYEGMDVGALLGQQGKARYDELVGDARDQNVDKSREEAWTAIAATKAGGPFTSLVPAPHDHDPTARINVEYFDQNGNPWDQKTAFHGPGTTSAEAMGDVAGAIGEQQRETYMNRAKSQKVPVGVLLDTTYVNQYDYELLWSYIFRRSQTGLIDLARLREVRVAEIEQSSPALHIDTAGLASGPAANVRQLELWSNGHGRDADGRSQITLDTVRKKSTIVDDLLANRPTDASWATFRNHDGYLPAGQFYREYSGGSILPDGNSARIVFNPVNNDVFITGTHYKRWTDTTRAPAVARGAFYRIV